MTLKQGNNIAEKLMKILVSEGTEGTNKIMEVLLNEVMKAERNEYLNAKPYERTEHRKGL